MLRRPTLRCAAAPRDIPRTVTWDGSSAVILTIALLCILCGPLAPFASAQTWVEQPSGTAGLLAAVHFPGPLDGWVVGDAGTLLRTVDGGQSWSPVALTGQDLEDVSFLDASTGLIVGDNGLVFRTVNGGDTWTQVPSGTGINLEAVTFGSGGMAYIGGRDGLILRSTDAGASWATAETGVDRYRNAAAMGPLRAWLVGDGGALRATTDGGLTWFDQPGAGGTDLGGISVISETEGWVSGQNSTVLYTDNAGATWTSRSSGLAVGVDGVSFVDPLEGWAAGNGGSVFHSTNGGLQWVAEPTPTTAELNDVYFVDASRGWAVGDLGTILFRGSTAGVESGAGIVEHRAAIELDQNRPNPFNPTTSIAFTLAVGATTTLAIHDAAGRLIAQPYDGFAGAGRHTVTWNGRTLHGDAAPSGVYFYRLESGGLVRAGRMVMQK
ncbi:MAG: YCF48-related protein [Candidatus Eiseniibacteriota bacterium]|jgi:photosystem II stability/assembly factor-like uncharacterized protein